MSQKFDEYEPVKILLIQGYLKKLEIRVLPVVKTQPVFIIFGDCLAMQMFLFAHLFIAL